MSVQAGMHRHSGVVLSRDPSAQGLGQVANGVLHENSHSQNPTAFRELRILIEKIKGSSPKRIVAQS